MLNKALSSLGLQGIKTDTLLRTPQLYPSQNLQGQIHFQGASVNKNINGIYLQLMTEAESGDHERKQELCIAQWHISGAFQLLANQSTQLQCAHNTTRVWLHTHLDADWGSMTPIAAIHPNLPASCYAKLCTSHAALRLSDSINQCRARTAEWRLLPLKYWLLPRNRIRTQTKAVRHQ